MGEDIICKNTHLLITTTFVRANLDTYQTSEIKRVKLVRKPTKRFKRYWFWALPFILASVIVNLYGWLTVPGESRLASTYLYVSLFLVVIGMLIIFRGMGWTFAVRLTGRFGVKDILVTKDENCAREVTEAIRSVLSKS